MSRYDLVIYGASGFTGQYVIDFVYRAAQEHGISWAVSGRNEGKLRAALDSAGARLGTSLSSTPLIIADSADQPSLLAMAAQAKLVLNCVGPYRFYGEPVVDACVESGTHHVDISGEPQYLEKMQLSYHQKAVENGVYVVGACGFDSIPSDMGQICVKKAMGGDVNSIETYLKVIIPNLPGASLNFGTWQSAIHGFANANELRGLRRTLYPERMPSTSPKLKPSFVNFWLVPMLVAITPSTFANYFKQLRREYYLAQELLTLGTLHYSSIVESWCLPFMGSDKSVMTRTQRGFYHDKDQRPAQIQTYVMLSSLWNCILTIFVLMIFGILAGFKWGRRILENYPGLCSLGRVSKNGVPKEKADNTNFEMTLVGEGWDSKAQNESEVKPNRRVTAVVRGKNVGYGATCECMVQAGLVILQEMDRLPNAGGVYPPGYAFAETSLVERLNKHEVTFTTSVEDI